MTLLILGIGQSLRHDDGVGPAAVRFWKESFPILAQNPNVQTEIEELPGLGLLNQLEGVNAAIVVDAVQSGAAPGTIHLLHQDNLDSFGPGAGSAHGWGVAETLALGRRLYPDSLPIELTLIGIEGQDFSPGEGLSAVVRDQLPHVAATINTLIQDHLARTGEMQ